MHKILSIIMVIILTAITTGCGLIHNRSDKGTNAGQASVSRTIRIGYLPSMAQAAFIVAKEKGWFKEEFDKDGIVIEYEKFITGPPLMEAFAGNRLDVGFVGDQPVIQAKANNIDLKIVGVCSATEKGAGMVVPAGSEITSPADIKGKKIGVSVGSIFHQILLLYLEENNLKPADIKLVNMNPPDMKTAIATKDIDAAVLGEPWISMIEYEKTGRQIADATGQKLTLNVIAGSTEFIQKNPDTIKRLLNVYDRAAKWLADHPEEGAELIANATGFKKEVVASAISKTVFDVRLTEQVVSSMADTSQYLRKSNTIRKDVDTKDLIDGSFLQESGLNQ